MYKSEFWTLWEQAGVGCFERTTCILSIVKQITSPGGMHETGARAWCTGKTQRNRVEREVEGGIGMGNTCNSMADSCQCMTKPMKCCEVISLQLIKINEKKNNNKDYFPIWAKTRKETTSSLMFENDALVFA